MARQTYSEKMSGYDESNILKLLAEMPKLLFDFMAYFQDQKSPSTRLAYLRDIRTFLLFLKKYDPYLNGLEIKKIDRSVLSRIMPDTIEAYLDYLSDYTQDGRKQHCSGAGKHRKLCSVRALYKYMVMKGYSDMDPTQDISVSVATAKTEELSDSDLKLIMNEILYGTHLSKRQMQFHDKTVRRDLAIVILLSYTGITLSELCALDYGDIVLQEDDEPSNIPCKITVTRKRGRKDDVLIDTECRAYLLNYLEERETLFPGRIEKNDPFFLSLQGYRMSNNTVHEMIKRYTRPVFPDKAINCKLFRTTKNLKLLRETEDTELISNFLGQQKQTTKLYIKKLSQ